MKMPKKSDVKINTALTKKIRAVVKNARLIKITLNIDEKSLRQLRKEAETSGVPYQRLINQFVKDSLEKRRGEKNIEKKDGVLARLERLEREIRLLKKRVA